MNGMSFHIGLSETILFKEWRTTDWPGMAGSMVGIILMGMLHEAIKNYRDHLYTSDALACAEKPKSRREAMFSTLHILQTVLHIVQVIMGYFMMFIFMTYNLYLCIAVVVGAGLGYFVFSWKNTRLDTNDCCN